MFSPDRKRTAQRIEKKILLQSPKVLAVVPGMKRV